MADFYETLQRLSWSPEEKRRLAWQYETGQPEERKLLEEKDGGCRPETRLSAACEFRLCQVSCVD